MIIRSLSLLIVALAVVMAACRPPQTTVEVVVRATNTPVPTSTPLPIVPTAIPAGSADNPLQLVVIPQADVTEADESAWEAALAEQGGVTVDVVTVATRPQAIEALCSTQEGVISAAWLDGISYAAARARNCGSPDVMAARDGALGEAGLLLLDRSLGTTQITALSGRVYCRLGYDDFYSWLLPLLAFRRADLDERRLNQIVDMADTEALVAAVVNGDCDGGGLGENAYNRLLEQDPTLADSARVAFTTPPVPYAILMYPLEVELGIRLSLTEGLLKLAESEEGSALMRPFLGQSALVRATDEELAAFNTFLGEVPLDFASIGN